MGDTVESTKQPAQRPALDQISCKNDFRRLGLKNAARLENLAYVARHASLVGIAGASR
jgi:hypothetical protein